MYKYETHCHTNVASRCGAASPEDAVDFYKACGYTGLIITEHFFNGNCSVPGDLPWEERIARYCLAYDRAKTRGDEVGLDVFLGVEISFRGTDFLLYDIDRAFLLAHPDFHRLTLNEAADLVHQCGGYVVHAHPFRTADYIDMIRLLPDKVDAVETINACRTEFENARADEYADHYHLLKFCGSDNHRAAGQRLISALELPERAESIHDLVRAVAENRHRIGLYEVAENEGVFSLTRR